jgi:hypothetical protein
MRLQKELSDFYPHDLHYWIWHHLDSGWIEGSDGWSEKAEAQLEIAFEVAAGIPVGTPGDQLEAWGTILERLSNLPWPTDPRSVTESQCKAIGIPNLIKHFFNSGDADLGELLLEIAFSAITDHCKSTLHNWHLLLERVENAEKEWRKAHSVHQAHHCAAH